MNWHLVLVVGVSVLQVIAVISYVRGMVSGTTRPNIVSWFLWECALLIALAAQLSAGASWSAVILVTALIVDGAVLCVAFFGYGYKKFGITDGVCLFLSLAAILLCALTDNPLVALVFAIFADATAYVPTMVKAFRDPFSETASTWLLSAVAGFLSILLASTADFANLAFPVYYVFINLVVWYGAFFGQRRIKI